MGSAIFYLLVFVITSLMAEVSSRLTEKSNKEKLLKYVFTLAVIAIPAFFAGIRYSIGTDYFPYVNIFNLSGVENFSRIEPGYNILNIIVKTLGGNEHILFFVVSFFTWGFVYRFLYNYRGSISVGIGMFIALLLFYNYSFNIVRQILSVAISLYAFKFIDDKDWNKFIMYSLLAVSMHVGALVIIPFYYIYNILGGKSKFFRAIIYLGIFLMVLNFSEIVEFISLYILKDPYYLKYGAESDVSLGLGVVVIFLPYILPGIIFAKKFSIKNKSFDLFLFLGIVSFLLRLIGYFSDSSINRIAYFVTISNIWLVSFYFKELKNNKKYFWIPWLVIISVVIYWFYTFILNNGAGTVPYITIF